MEEMNLIFFLNFSKKSIQCGIHYLMNYVKNYFHNLNIYIYIYIYFWKWCTETRKEIIWKIKLKIKEKIKILKMK